MTVNAFKGPSIFLANHPNVKRAPCSDLSLSGFDHCLVISQRFHQQYAGLNHYQGSDRVLEGVLVNRNGKQIEDSRVSVTLTDEDNAHVIYINYSFNL